MKSLSADIKHHILLEYSPHSHTHNFAALAAKHGVAGGGEVVRRWHAQWDGTPQSLERKPVAGRPRILSRAQVTRHIRVPILAANRAHRAVHYTQLLPRVRQSTGKQVTLRTIQRYGKEQLGAKDKQTTKRTADESKSTHTCHNLKRLHGCCTGFSLVTTVSVDLCEQIAEMRRKLRKIGTHKVLFLDETALRLSEAPTHTVVLPGEQAYVVATETSSYSKRYDMIACCTGDQVLLPKIFTPKERSDASVRGINGLMLQQFIDDTLAQAVEGLDSYPLTLVLDRAPIHKNVDQLLQAFRDRSSESIKQILLLPPNAAKRLSPLDNSLFHDWKEVCRKHTPLTTNNIEQVMSDAWNKMKPEAHYKNCGLTRSKDVYFDCPAPAVHRHDR